MDSKEAAELFLRAVEMKLKGEDTLVMQRDRSAAARASGSRNRRPAELIINGREMHYMNGWFLSRFINVAGMIMKRKHSGLNAKQQRKMAKEVKRARQLGLLPIVHRYMPGIDANLPGQALRNPLAPP